MIVLLAAGAVLAQPQSARPAYEAASVKLNTSGSGNSSSKGSKGQIVFTNQTLKRLIERAYSVKPFQVPGPGWMETVHFDIAAKYPPDSKDDDRSLMLRTLLEDRFKLAVHRESKDMPGYALVVAKSGFKLKPVEPGGSDTNTNGDRVRTLTAKKTSMAILTDLVARWLGEVVVDKTGIDGVYDFELRWTNDDQPANGIDAAAAPSLFTALQETLGLRLQPQKVPVDIVVVDHVERVPTEN
ncbi:MAG TPA: TIGR03435 family protein [Candidatus Acidoferrales bacterium]|nr:TIGR03435 family protein [Candidatus Acidoferrales bacterium]